MNARFLPPLVASPAFDRRRSQASSAQIDFVDLPTDGRRLGASQDGATHAPAGSTPWPAGAVLTLPAGVGINATYTLTRDGWVEDGRGLDAVAILPGAAPVHALIGLSQWGSIDHWRSPEDAYNVVSRRWGGDDLYAVPEFERCGMIRVHRGSLAR